MCDVGCDKNWERKAKKVIRGKNVTLYLGHRKGWHIVTAVHSNGHIIQGVLGYFNGDGRDGWHYHEIHVLNGTQEEGKKEMLILPAYGIYDLFKRSPEEIIADPSLDNAGWEHLDIIVPLDQLYAGWEARDTVILTQEFIGA